MEVAILIEPSSLQNKLTALLTLIIVQREQSLLWCTYTFFLSSEMNCSEINIIRICGTYFAMDNKMINIYIYILARIWNTKKTILKHKINLSASVLNQS